MDNPILTILVVFIGITVGVFSYVFRWLMGQRAQTEAIVEAKLREVWAKMNQVDQELSSDRRSASDFRERIAREMITKEDLRNEVTRLISELDRRLTNTIQRSLPRTD